MIEFRSLAGLSDYKEVYELQKDLVERRIQNRIPDTILFLEHEGVITRGRGLQRGSVEGSARHRELVNPNLPVVEIERGGDLTVHEPGQLVIYPIVKLGDSDFVPKKDIGLYLRKLEGVLIDLLADYGLEGDRKKNATGVWVNEQKVASVGIAVRKWVTYHGAAINVVNELQGFQSVSPCGFSPNVMTTLSRLKTELRDQWKIDSGDWRREIESRLMKWVQFRSTATTKPSSPEVERTFSSTSL